MISPDQMFECEACQVVLCRDCLDEKVGEHWNLGFLYEEEEVEQDGNSPMCPSCNKLLLSKRLNRKVDELMRKRIQIKHECIST